MIKIKTPSKITLCNKPLFDEKVVEVVDPIHNQRYWFIKCKNGKQFTDILTKIIPGYTDLVEVSDDEELTGGECVDLVIDGRLVVVLWCNPVDVNSLFHEILHAVLFSAKSRGISRDDDEPLCYMVGFLVGEILSKLNISLKRGRKVNKIESPLEFDQEDKEDAKKV